MAACWALEPAPTRSPLSCAAELLPLAAVVLPPSFEAPQAARASEPATAADTAAVRVVVLSFNSVPFDRRGARTSMPGRWIERTPCWAAEVDGSGCTGERQVNASRGFGHDSADTARPSREPRRVGDLRHDPGSPHVLLAQPAR